MPRFTRDPRTMADERKLSRRPPPGWTRPRAGEDAPGDRIWQRAPALSPFLALALSSRPTQRRSVRQKRARRAESIVRVHLLPGVSFERPADGNYAACLRTLAGSVRSSRVILTARASAEARAAAKGSQVAPPPAAQAGTAPTTAGVLFPADRHPGPLPTGASLVLLPAGAKYEFRYRTVSFSVPASWLQDFLGDWRRVWREDDSTYSHGACLSAGDTLDLLWAPFRSTAVGSHSMYEKMLGCFNIPYDYKAAGSLFWTYGPGAPAKIFFYAMQLIETYSGEIEYQPSEIIPSGFSKGLGGFIKELLSKGSATNPAGKTCYSRILFRNKGGTSSVNNGLCNQMDTKCSSWTTNTPVSQCDGVDWNAFPITWDSSNACISSDGSYACAPPLGNAASDTAAMAITPANSRCGGVNLETYGDTWATAAHPSRQAFRGEVADYEMFLARIALSYGFHQLFRFRPDEGLPLIEAASRLARYALRVALDLAQAVVHEFGHLFGGMDHCDVDNFQEVCARHFGCRVRGRLGLPMNAYLPRALPGFSADDYESSDHIEDTTDADLSQPNTGIGSLKFVYRCDVIDLGAAGQDAGYCATGCLQVSTSREWYLNLFGTLGHDGGYAALWKAADLAGFCSAGVR